MSVALKLYEQLTDAGEDKQRAHLIAEAFEKIEERYPEIKDLATHDHVREGELRLLKEIKETEGRLRSARGVYHFHSCIWGVGNEISRG